jgi:hypothetical protein
MKRVYQFFALLCCFTLLGAEVGPPALTLAVQIRRNRHEYGVLRDSVRTTVGKQVTGLLVRRIANGFPASFPRDVNAIASLDKKIRGLADELRQVQQFGGTAKDLRAFLKSHPPATEAEGPGLTGTRRDHESPDAEITADEIADKSYEEIRASEKLLPKPGEEGGSGDVGLQARKDLTLELFKSIREGLKSVLLDSYIKELPIVGSLHDILSQALDKSAKDYIDRKADEIALSVPTQRDVLDKSISDAAREISGSIRVEVTPRMVARYRGRVAEWNAEARTVDTLAARAPNEIARAQLGLTRGPAQPATKIERLPTPPKPTPRQNNEDALETFRRGLDSGWIVTRNSGADPSKIFVHRTSDSYGLRDLKYLVREEPDGTWTVYRPRETFGGSEYGRRIGIMPRPFDVSVGECTCR